jgi:hypothetical protein
MTRFVARAVRLVGLVVAAWVVSGCGGHGSSSHSTGPSLAGRYVGTAKTVLTGPGSSAPVNGGIEFDVGADNKVTVSDPGQPPFGSGTLNGNAFTVAAPGSAFNGSGVSCGGGVTFNGTISGTSMSGNVSSSGLVCNGLPFTITGTFTATLQAELPTGSTGGGIGQRLRDALRP